MEEMTFENYPAERLRIDSVASRITPEENRIRLVIFDEIIRTGGPVGNKELKEHPGLTGVDLTAVLASMEEKKAVVLDEEKRVLFAYPVCAVPTNHKVTLADGRQFHAMCAVDAMGTAFTFRQDVQIDSCCSQCGEPVTVKIQNGRVQTAEPAGLQVLHVDLNRLDNWAGSC